MWSWPPVQAASGDTARWVAQAHRKAQDTTRLGSFKEPPVESVMDSPDMAAWKRAVAAKFLRAMEPPLLLEQKLQQQAYTAYVRSRRVAVTQVEMGSLDRGECKVVTTQSCPINRSDLTVLSANPGGTTPAVSIPPILARLAELSPAIARIELDYMWQHWAYGGPLKRGRRAEVDVNMGMA